MLKINVTIADIRLSNWLKGIGNYNALQDCPIGQAIIREQFADKNYIYMWKYLYVGGMIISIEDEKYKTTKRMQKFIVDYDSGKKVEPSNFILKEKYNE